MPRLVLCLLLALLSQPVAADPLAGLWQTEPDRRNLVSHIRIAPCGAALCGTVAKAFDRQGRAVVTPNVGRRLFWNLVARGGGVYDGGTVHVPLLDVTARARASLSGDRLRVTACKGPICDGQTWVRVD